MHYLVTWEIDVEANSPQEAAKLALAIQRDPESTATFFGVRDVDGKPKTIYVDLADEQ